MSVLARNLRKCTIDCESSPACVPSCTIRVQLEVEPLLRERLVLSSEVGRPPSQLQEDFPGCVYFKTCLFSLLPKRSGHTTHHHAICAHG